jgi:uncharacterized protein (TIGR00369 family)
MSQAWQSSASDEIFSEVQQLFTDRIPFNRVLGVSIDSMTFERARLRFDFRDELVGNYIRRSLHGGVVSASLDLVGGLVAFLSAIQSLEQRPVAEKMEHLANVGTIDLRIDYLRPGVGSHFVADGSILRAGNKVAVTRMELHNDEERLIAVGSGAYLVG